MQEVPVLPFFGNGTNFNAPNDEGATAAFAVFASAAASTAAIAVVSSLALLPPVVRRRLLSHGSPLLPLSSGSLLLAAVVAAKKIAASANAGTVLTLSPRICRTFNRGLLRNFAGMLTLN